MKRSAWEVQASVWNPNNDEEYWWTGTVLYMSKDVISNAAIAKAIRLYSEGKDHVQTERLNFLADYVELNVAQIEKKPKTFWVVE